MTMETTKAYAIDVPQAVAATAEKHCDTESTRFALGGVHFEQDGRDCYAVATDGRQLIKYSWESDNEADFVSEGFPNGQALAKAARAMKGRKSEPKKAFLKIETSENDSFSATVSNVDTQTSVDLIQGRFPMWRDVIQFDKSKFVTTRLDAKFLRQLCDSVIKNHVGSETTYVDIFVKDAESAVHFEAEGTDYHENSVKIESVIMPLAKG